MPIINYGITTIYYCQYKQTRIDVKISIDLVNGVEVFAPENLDEPKLVPILKQKAPWISQKLEELNEVHTTVQPKEFVSGEKLPYLGRHYRLKIYKEPVPNASFQFKQGRFIARWLTENYIE